MPSPGWLLFSPLDLLATWQQEFFFVIHRHIDALATKMEALLRCQEIGPEFRQGGWGPSWAGLGLWLKEELETDRAWVRMGGWEVGPGVRSQD